MLFSLVDLTEHFCLQCRRGCTAHTSPGWTGSRTLLHFVTSEKERNNWTLTKRCAATDVPNGAAPDTPGSLGPGSEPGITE